MLEMVRPMDVRLAWMLWMLDAASARAHYKNTEPDARRFSRPDVRVKFPPAIFGTQSCRSTQLLYQGADTSRARLGTGIHDRDIRHHLHSRALGYLGHVLIGSSWLCRDIR